MAKVVVISFFILSCIVYTIHNWYSHKHHLWITPHPPLPPPRFLPQLISIVKPRNSNRHLNSYLFFSLFRRLKRHCGLGNFPRIYDKASYFSIPASYRHGIAIKRLLAGWGRGVGSVAGMYIIARILCTFLGCYEGCYKPSTEFKMYIATAFHTCCS